MQRAAYLPVAIQTRAHQNMSLPLTECFHAGTGSVEEMQPAYNASMPSLQDTSFNEFVRSLDANGLDAASLGHVGIMDEVAAPQGFINVPGQSELQVG